MENLPLAQVPWTALDFEGAGELPGQADVPIQAGMAQAIGTQAPEASQLYRTFIAANRPVALAARKVHGITDQDLAGAPELSTLWPEFKQQLHSRVLVAHNASVERRYLRAFPGHGFGPWIDTLPLARRFYPQLSNHRLGDLIVTFELEEPLNQLCPGLQWHDALYDAAAALLFLQHLIRSAGLEEQPLRLLLNR